MAEKFLNLSDLSRTDAVNVLYRVSVELLGTCTSNIRDQSFITLVSAQAFRNLPP